MMSNYNRDTSQICADLHRQLGLLYAYVDDQIAPSAGWAFKRQL